MGARVAVGGRKASFKGVWRKFKGFWSTVAGWVCRDFKEVSEKGRGWGGFKGTLCGSGEFKSVWWSWGGFKGTW